ncbi:hypothetical protein [Desulfosediminicola flagellatus]|uniref:hypothetical protein n=1 Tax=Desulfosediminicola flagellatus TaxID=2569541 RepID=UPI0010ACABF4|nr:hypothetical protein [Desulfosediminicola flagellatus]
MAFLAYKKQILGILVENLKNSQPQVVDSRKIAQRLNLSIKETCQMIKVMNSKGLVESDQDGQRALITREGLSTLSSMGLSRAA